MDQENKPPMSIATDLTSSRRAPYAQQSHQPFAKSAAKRQSVMALPPIAHLQHQYAKLSVKPKTMDKRSASGTETRKSAHEDAENDDDEHAFLPPTPAVPPLSHRLPWDDNAGSATVMLDERIMSRHVVKVLAELRAIWCIQHHGEFSSDDFADSDGIQKTVGAVRTIKQWHMAQPAFTLSKPSSQGPQNLSKLLMKVLEATEALASVESGATRDRKSAEARELVLTMSSEVESLLALRRKTGTRQTVSHSNTLASVTPMEEPEDMVPEWAVAGAFGDDDSLERFRAVLDAYLPDCRLSALDDESFVTSLTDGILLCLAFNAIVRDSHKPFGFIPEANIFRFDSASEHGQQPLQPTSVDMDRRESSSSTSSTDMGGEGKVGDTFRRTRNLTQWAAAVKTRYLVSLPRFEPKVVARRSAENDQEWRAMLTDAVKLFTSAVVTETREEREIALVT
ncbi:hypothetical protein ACM66B_001725 [Microbotryomycetes sp. NB124-2]